MGRNMIHAAFITQHASWPWMRQLPKDNPVMDGVRFFAPLAEAQIAFVYDALPSDSVDIPESVPVIFVCSEPENVKRYNPRFLAQFDTIITTDRQTAHHDPIFTQPGLPWHAGSMAAGGKLLADPMTFEDFRAHKPVKTKLVSVVSSDKAFTPEHRARLAFVSKLKEALGEQVDVFGRGIADFADKRDVLDQYRYHIAIENCSIPHYWTEKIADPFLTLTFPIYHGCPNITDYFPEESLRSINIYDPDEAIKTIKQVIESDLAEQHREQLLAARRSVMNEHNVFGLLASLGNDVLETNRGTWNKRTIYHESHFLPFQARVKLRLHSLIGRIPMLRKFFRTTKEKAYLARKRIKHVWKYITNEFYRSHQKWIRDNPSDDIRFRYDLPQGANILDVGGYVGDFAARYVEICDANLLSFEPVPKFAQQIRNRFAKNPRVQVFEAGLSDQDQTAEFDLDADASGAFGSPGGERVQVALWDAERFLSQHGTEQWHLVKLNIEGGEFALLNRLIDTGRIVSIEHLQVQFHLHVPGARAHYMRLANRLRQTHDLQWRYPFVWESWRRKDVVGGSRERK